MTLMYNNKNLTNSNRTHFPTLLLIEDNEDDVVMIKAFLPNEFKFIWCSSADEARPHLSNDNLDLILLDHGLPDTNALSFLEEIKLHCPHLPVIILTGNEDPALAVSAIKKGAVNYLLKDEIADHLLTIVQSALGDRHLTVETDPTLQGEQTATRFEESAENVYHTLLDTMNEGCLMVTANGMIALVNEAISQITGTLHEQLLGHSVYQLFDDETAVSLQTHLTNLQQTTTPQTHKFEGRIKGKNAHLIPVLISSKSMHDENGRFRDCLFILTDISEQVSVKQAIYKLYHNAQEQQGQLTALIESSQDGLVLVTQDLYIPVINRQTRQLLNLPNQNDMWGNQTIHEFLDIVNAYTPAAVEAFQKAIEYLQSDHLSSCEGEFEANQSFIQWQVWPVAIKNLQLGYLIIFRDITKEHDLEMLRQELTRTMVHDLRKPHYRNKAITGND